MYNSQYQENNDQGKQKQQQTADGVKGGDKQQVGGMGTKLPTEKMYKRQNVMENFRMRILRNLDLAFEIVQDEGFTILKKYSDLNFYLTNLANDKKYRYLAQQKVQNLQNKVDLKTMKKMKTMGKPNKKNKISKDDDQDSFATDSLSDLD